MLIQQELYKISLDSNVYQTYVLAKNQIKQFIYNLQLFLK